MQMPGWFDIYDWPIGVKARDDREGKLAAMAQIEKVVEKLESEGVDKSRIVVGGFSQGGAIAILSAYRSNERPYAGCVALSGWLTLKDDWEVSEAVKSTPMYWGHGKYDDKVLFEQQEHGVELLRHKGITVTAKDYPVGHQADEEELRDFATFLDDLLFGKSES
jgi:lysophospholipase-2